MIIEDLAIACRLLRGMELRLVAADQLRAFPPEQLLSPPVDIDDQPRFGVGNDDRVVGRFEQRLRALPPRRARIH